ncbi:MAG: hypothetical protein OEX77_11155 [Candidatus Bathyarchaeota archaeon]|nr:hypothetical protein [Candidatus Bathyarchaeota archaeon]MDH5734090.1 hypothetical protein [Candidatus Bathyarchaeota archaeon]
MTDPDFDKLRFEVLELHKQEIEAHLNKNVDFFVHNISENYLSVSRGAIRKPSKDEIRSQFSNYLNNTTFVEYRDLQAPIIEFSDDGSVAWSIVRVKVTGIRTMNDGTERELDFVCAWITLYRRQNDKWIRVGEVSSFK